MAVVAEELISDLIVRDGKLRSGVRSAQQAYGAGIGSMRNDTKRFESEFNRSSENISTGFKRLAGTIAAGISIDATTRLIDSYTRFQNQLRVAGLEGQKLLEVQERLRAIGTNYGVELESLANVFNRASLAQKELGASTEDIIRLNEIVAASMRVTGASAEQSRGALLQLSQAIGQDVVRGEEFNSILEGALPIAQAAARGIERFGGSVAKLRAEVIKGNVSSREFFEGVLKGGEQTIAQAEKANITLAQSFTALRNELMLYVGSAAQANGVTGALAAGIKSLADNLDTIIPALAVIATAIGIRYVAALAAGAVSTVALRLAALQTTTALGTMGAVATTAGRAMLLAFGGPVGVAIAAIGAVLAYVTYESAKAEAAAAALKQQYQDSQTQLDGMIIKLQDAGVSTEDLARISDIAAGRIDTLADSYNRASVEAHKMATEISKATIALLAQAAAAGAAGKADADQARRELAAEQRNARRREGFVGAVGGSGDPDRGAAARIAELRKRISDGDAEQRRSDAQQEAALIAFERRIDLGAGPSAPAAAADEKKKKARARKGEDLAEKAAQEAYRNDQELRSLLIEELRAKEDLAATAKERGDLQRQSLALERDQRLAELDEAVRRKDLTAEEAKARLLIIENLYGAADEIKAQSRESAYEERITHEQKRDAERDRADLAQTELGIRRDELQFQLDMADTQAERRRIAIQILEAETETHRKVLQGVIATEAVNSAKRKQAEADLAALDTRSNRDAQRIGRDTENPLERLARESSRTAAQVTEDIQSIQAEGLNALGDGITDVIMQTRSLGDVFKSVANQIISDLIRIAVQRAIIGPLANALFPGTSSNASAAAGIAKGIKGVTSLFRAGGGPVSAGQLYRVNEGQQEFFRPATDGRVVPLSQAQAARPAASAMQGPTIVQLAVAPGEMFVPIVEGISGNVAVRTVQATAPGIVRAATIETTRRAGRPRT